MKKPKALRAGSMLGIVSPASTPKEASVAAGVARLESLGYRTKVFPHALDRGPLSYAGTLGDRLRDLHAAYADPEVDGIICTRGGWGAAELLPYLDTALIGANLKMLLGYSDITSLHVWLAREMGVVTFQAPMVASEFAKTEERGPEMEIWRAALEGAAGWQVGPEQGMRVLRGGAGLGTSFAPVRGVLSGGCISIYVEGLGTPYGPVPVPEGESRVLFLEDVGVKPYQWDRMLVHLRYAGMLAGVTGIVFGDMHECVDEAEMPELEAALLHALKDFAGPIAIGLKSGHVATRNVTLPFGVEVALECDEVGNPAMYFVEAAVEV